MKVRGLFILALLLAIPTFASTHVFFDLADFNAAPATNRLVSFQAQSPFVGNLINYTSSPAGTFWVSNMTVGDWYGVIKAKSSGGVYASAIEFQVSITSESLGLVYATNITSVLGTSTYPTAGRSAWSIQASDNRYARIGDGGLAFTPQFGSENLTNWSALDTNILSDIVAGTSALASNLVMNPNLTNVSMYAFGPASTPAFSAYDIAGALQMKITDEGLFLPELVDGATDFLLGANADGGIQRYVGSIANDTSGQAGSVAAAVTNQWLTDINSSSNSLYATFSSGVDATEVAAIMATNSAGGIQPDINGAFNISDIDVYALNGWLFLTNITYGIKANQFSGDGSLLTGLKSDQGYGVAGTNIMTTVSAGANTSVNPSTNVFTGQVNYQISASGGSSDVLWTVSGDDIYPSGAEGTTDAWTSLGDDIYPQ